MTEINLNATPQEIQAEIENELARSKEVHAENFDSWVTAYGVITEEYYEVVEAFRMSKEKYPEGNINLRIELGQLSAMCIKASESCCSKRFGKITDLMHIAFTHTSTMNSLGYIALAYKGLDADLSNKELHTRLLHFARTCKAAIMSNCVHVH